MLKRRAYTLLDANVRSAQSRGRGVGQFIDVCRDDGRVWHKDGEKGCIPVRREGEFLFRAIWAESDLADRSKDEENTANTQSGLYEYTAYMQGL